MVGKSKRQIINKKIGEGVSKKTNETIEKLEHCFALDCSPGEACVYANISVSTYYNWIKEDPELLERFELLRSKPTLKARTIIIDNLNDGNLEVAKWYLERKRKHEFSIRQDNIVGNYELKDTDVPKRVTREEWENAE